METSAVPQMDLNAKVDRIVPVAWMIMEGAMKAGGLHMLPSMREGGAAVKYVNQSKTAYQGNPLVERVIDTLDRKSARRQKTELEDVDLDDVIGRVDEIVPLLDAEGGQGMEAKTFLYGLAETMVSASGSGHLSTGPRINEVEAKYLADLKAHLRI